VPATLYGCWPGSRGSHPGSGHRKARQFGNACFYPPRLAGWHPVDDPSEFDEQPSAHSGGQGGAFPIGRAAIVLVMFVLATVLLLRVIHPSATTSATGSATTSATGSASTTPSTTHQATPTTTTTSAHPPSSVPVLVANASGVSGAAATVTNQLQVGGWALQPPVNASAQVPASHVYYVAGQEQAATQIAKSLHLPASAVVPYTTAAPITSIGTAEVVVVVGPDLARPTSATTTTAAAARTSTS